MKLRPDLPPLPSRMRRLRISDAGYPVPWFVPWLDGKPEFRTITQEKFAFAVRKRACWLCGDTLTRLSAFVLGPMCAVNRTNGEPPCHVNCARFAAKACPFLTRPQTERRTDGLPETDGYAEGAILRNPGCCAVWATPTWSWFRNEGGVGALCHIGPAEWVEWYCEGRQATADEVRGSIDSGLPILCEMASRQGPGAERELRKAVIAALELLPA